VQCARSRGIRDSSEFPICNIGAPGQFLPRLSVISVTIGRLVRPPASGAQLHFRQAMTRDPDPKLPEPDPDPAEPDPVYPPLSPDEPGPDVINPVEPVPAPLRF